MHSFSSIVVVKYEHKFKVSRIQFPNVIELTNSRRFPLVCPLNDNFIHPKNQCTKMAHYNEEKD